MRRTDRPSGNISKFASNQVSELRRAEISSAISSKEDAKGTGNPSGVIAHSKSFRDIKKNASILVVTTDVLVVSSEMKHPLLLHPAKPGEYSPLH